MKLEAEKRAELLMEEARKRGKDPMEFALHQQEILNYMEKIVMNWFHLKIMKIYLRKKS